MARSRLALLAAAALVTAVVGSVLVFGIARPPQLASVADQPDPSPPAAVAWRSVERGDGCVSVARPDGSSAQLVCESDLGEVLAWDDDGIVVGGGRWPGELRWLDRTTGEVLERRSVDDPWELDPRGRGSVVSRVRDGVLTVRYEDTVLWEVEAPEGYRITEGTVSPDGSWVAMVDTTARLLVVPADGSAPPRIWAEEAVTWSTPVWEGTLLDGP